jgi:hypothetical protein
MSRKFDHLLVIVRGTTPFPVVKKAVASARLIATGEGNNTFATAPITVLFDGTAERFSALQREYDGRAFISALRDWQPDPAKRYRVAMPSDVSDDYIVTLAQEAFGMHPYISTYDVQTGQA